MMPFASILVGERKNIERILWEINAAIGNRDQVTAYQKFFELEATLDLAGLDVSKLPDGNGRQTIVVTAR
jgi:hypothetical protein